MVRKFWRNVSIGLILLRWPYDWFGKNLNFIELFANSLLHYFADDLDLCLNCKEKKVFCFGCQMIARLKKVRKIVANLIFFVVVVMFYNFFLPFFLVCTYKTPNRGDLSRSTKDFYLFKYSMVVPHEEKWLYWSTIRRSRCSFTTLSSHRVPHHHTWVITFKRDAESYLPPFSEKRAQVLLPFETPENFQGKKKRPATTLKLQLNYAGFSKETFRHDSATNLLKTVRNHVP